jgi:hypothetical protein
VLVVGVSPRSAIIQALRAASAAPRRSMPAITESKTQKMLQPNYAPLLRIELPSLRFSPPSIESRRSMIPPLFGRTFAALLETATSTCWPSEASNHVHLLLALPSGRNISDVMRDIKANSSRFIRTKHRLFAWQDGYAAVSVSPSQLPGVKKYIANQEEHHRVRCFEDEYLALLKRSGANFDPNDFLG